MGTKNPVHSFSEGTSFSVICNALTHNAITKSTQESNAETVADVHSQNWILFLTHHEELSQIEARIVLLLFYQIVQFLEL